MEGSFLGWSPKGHGKIRPDDGSNVVILFKSDSPELSGVRENARLRFEIVETSDGKRSAKNAQVVAGEMTGKPGRGVVKFWNESRGHGYIERANGAGDARVQLSQIPENEGGYLSPGLEVEYLEVEGKDNRFSAHSLKVLGWTKGYDPLSNFADMGRPGWLEALAGMAEREPWAFNQSPEDHDSLPVLRSYFSHTFRRLVEMSDGIGYSKTEQHAAINTGLVTANQEEIYAIFIKHDKPGRQDWKFAGFKKASDWDFVNNFGSSPPPLADYFQDPSVLLYDRRCNLYINYDHVMENIDRFPKDLQNQPYMARQLLTSAEGNTKKRVYRNYKTAIPQFYRDRGGSGSVQLLLPICLTNPAKADLALVAERSESSDAYRSSTILTLEMAYKNARLLARPDNEWLQP